MSKNLKYQKGIAKCISYWRCKFNFESISYCETDSQLAIFSPSSNTQSSNSNHAIPPAVKPPFLCPLITTRHSNSTCEYPLLCSPFTSHLWFEGVWPAEDKTCWRIDLLLNLVWIIQVFFKEVVPYSYRLVLEHWWITRWGASKELILQSQSLLENVPDVLCAAVKCCCLWLDFWFTLLFLLTECTQHAGNKT